MHRVAIAVCAVLIAGCTAGEIDQGQECGANGECPAGFECDPKSNRCIAVGGQLPADAASKPDAPPPSPDAAVRIDAVLELHVDAGGSVVGTGGLTCGGGDCQSTMVVGTRVTLTAQPSDGYRFAGWTGDGGCASVSGNPVEIVVGGNMRCAAGFVPVFKVAATVNGSSSIQVTASSPASTSSCTGASCTVDGGGSVTLTAGSGADVRFVGWAGDPACTGTSPALVISPVTAAVSCVAKYVGRRTVKGTVSGATGAVVAASPDDTTTCTGDTCVADVGSQVTLTAPTIAGFRFVGWTGQGCASSGAVVTVDPVSADVTCTAAYVAGIAVVGSVSGATGTITAASDSPSAMCAAGTCIIDSGQNATLTAPAIPGYRFAGWKGDTGCTGTSTTLALTSVTTSVTCSASYVKRVALSYGIEGEPVAPAGGLTIGASDPLASCENHVCTIDAFTKVNLTAPTLAGWRFTGWDGACSGGAMTSVTPGSDTTCTATYIRLQTVTFAASPPAAGLVSVSGGGCAASGCTVDYGTPITFSYSATTGYRFGSWVGDCTAAADPTATATANTDLTCTASFVARRTVTFGASPPAGGSVTVSGGGCASSGCTVDSGTPLTFTYAVNAGYRFNGWTGCTAGAGNTATATADADVTCTAAFVQQFTVTYSASPSAGGGVTASGGACASSGCLVDAGTSMTFSYSLNSGYRFDKWTGDCVATTGNMASATANGNLTCTATYIQQQTVTYAASPTAGGGVTASGGGCAASGCSVDKGTAMTFSYSLNSGYRFDKWTGDCVATTSNMASATANANLTCTANFIQRFTVTYAANPVAGGSVTASGGGCGASGCAVDAGTVMTFSYAANSGYKFTGWTGCTATTGNMSTATASSNVTCTAGFAPQYTVTYGASPAAGGSVSASGGSCGASGCLVDAGTVMTFSYTQNPGYKFNGWTGCTATTANMATATANANVTCTATFLQQFTVTYSASPSAGGSVTASGGGCGASGCAVNAGTVMTFNYSMNAGYRFNGWTGCTGTTGTMATATANANVTCTANFVQRFSVTYSANPAAGGSVTASGGGCAASGCLVDAGTVMTFNYAMNGGYRFTGWTGCTGTTGTMATATANANVTCTAGFVARYTISLFASPSAGGGVSLSGSGCSGTSCTVDAGAVVTIAASENSNYRFTRWSGCTSSSAASVNVTVNSTTSCTAGYYGLWAVSYGLAGLDYGFSVIPLEDDTLSLAGVTNNGRTNDGLVQRLDPANGDRVMPDTALHDAREASSYIRDAIPMGDAITATLVADSAGGEHAGLVIWSKAQDITLRREYVPDWQLFSSFTPVRLIRTSTDGGFLIIGTAYFLRGAVNMTYVVKLDKLGAVLWTTTYHAGNTDLRYPTDARAVVEVSGGYIVASAVDKGGTPRWYTLLTFIDTTGKTGWTALQSFGKKNNTPYDLTKGLNGEVIVAGAQEESSGASSSFCGTFPCDAFLMIIDPTSGAPKLTRTLGRLGFTDYFYRIVTGSGQYIGVGTTRWDDKRNTDVWFATISEKLLPIDQSAFGGTGVELGLHVAELTIGFVVTGLSSSFGSVYELWAVRLDDNGMLDGFNAAANAGIGKPTYAPVIEAWTTTPQALSLPVTTKALIGENALGETEIKLNQLRQAP